jgi:uncharacterized protein with beta-barrel porin domain
MLCGQRLRLVFFLGALIAGASIAPLQAANLGGNCCADLEQRLDELRGIEADELRGPLSLHVLPHLKGIRFSDGSFSLKVPSLAGVTVDSNDNPFVVDGDHIAVLDRTAFANADRSGAAVLRGVDEALAGELGDVSAEPHFGVWTAGFGGFADLDGGGDVFNAEQSVGGGLAGITFRGAPGLAVGVFGGAARTVYESQYHSEEIATDYGLAGVFGRYVISQLVADFSLTAGWSSTDGKRLIASNMRGFRTSEAAASDYDGWIVSPKIGIGMAVPLIDGAVMVPAVKVRGQLQHIDGYAEDGSTADARISSREIDDIEERLELGFYQHILDELAGDMSVHARIGGSVLERLGDRDVHAEMLSSSFGFNSGLPETEVGGYVGVGFDIAVLPNVTLFGDTEMLLTERSRSVDGAIGLSAKF